MDVCSGNGFCLEPCVCECRDFCTCGHGDHLDISEENRHYGYCQRPCKYNCKLVACFQYLHCREKFPLWFLQIYRDDLHKDFIHHFLNFDDACEVCNDYRYMVQIPCSHTVCFDCYEHINQKEERLCPICYDEL